MFKIAIVFMVLGLFSLLLGANGVGGLSMDIGKTLLYIFFILALISFVANLITSKRIERY
jgi:uncharacterized membrane protein YtjA (UPF0391 family)